MQRAHANVELYDGFRLQPALLSLQTRLLEDFLHMHPLCPIHVS